MPERKPPTTGWHLPYDTIYKGFTARIDLFDGSAYIPMKIVKDAALPARHANLAQ
jgi:hypothetical protein